MKKIIALLCSLLCLFSLTACASSSSNDISAEDQAAMESTALNMLAQSMQTDDTSYEAIMDMRDEEIDYALLNIGIPCSGENYKKILTSWRSGVEEVGDIDIASLDEFTFSKKNNEIIASTEAKFAERDASIDFTFKEDGTVTSLTIGGKYSTGEILKKAGLNTLIGMGTCFTVLIFIALIISLFKFIGREKKASGEEGIVQKEAAPAAAPKAAPKAETPATPADDTALIAVISAAIAAYEGGAVPGTIKSITRRSAGTGNEGMPPANIDQIDGFAARSIRRSSSANWKRR